VSRPGHRFPSPDELPIPRDVGVGVGWTAQMREMADHIGAYATLLIVDRFGGQEVYVAIDAERNAFRDLIGAAAAKTISHVYGREYLQIPTGKHALREARRRGVLDRVRAEEISAGEAARMLKTSRSYLAHLLNTRDEWGLPLEPALRARALASLGMRDPVAHPEDWQEGGRGGARADRQMDLFGEDEEG